MKLAHSVCTGEMFVSPELWWLLGVWSLARPWQMSSWFHGAIPGRPPGSLSGCWGCLISMVSCQSPWVGAASPTYLHIPPCQLAVLDLLLGGWPENLKHRDPMDAAPASLGLLWHRWEQAQPTGTARLRCTARTWGCSGTGLTPSESQWAAFQIHSE